MQILILKSLQLEEAQFLLKNNSLQKLYQNLISVTFYALTVTGSNIFGVGAQVSIAQASGRGNSVGDDRKSSKTQ